MIFVPNTYISLPLLIVGIADFAIALIVVYNHRQSHVHLTVSFLSIFLGLFAISIGLMSAGFSPNQMVFGFKGAAFAGAPIPLLLFLLSKIFPDKNLDFSPWVIMFLSIPFLFFAIFSFTNVWLGYNYLQMNSVSISIVPFFVTLYLLYYVIYLIAAARNFYGTARASAGLKKLQLNYLLSGFYVAVVVGAVCNVLMTFLNFPGLVYFGPMASIFLVGFTSYAILRHRLLDIEIIIKRSFVFTSLVSAIICVYALSLFVLQYIFQQAVGISQWLATTITILAVLIAYEPLKTFFANISDNLFFMKKYEYRATLKNLAQGLARLMPLKVFIKLLLRNIVRVVKLNGGVLLIYDEVKENYIVVAAERHSKALRDKVVLKDHMLIKELGNRDYLLAEDVEHYLRDRNISSADRKRLETVQKEMKELKSSLCVPCRFQGKISGVICLDEKLSQDSFSQEDIDLFTFLAPQVATSIYNCKMYGSEKEKRVMAEEKMNIAQKAAEEKARLATLGTLSAGLAHEIRNPMTVLKSRAEGILKTPTDEEYVKNTGSLFIKHIDRILNISDKMLSFAKTKQLPGQLLDVSSVLNESTALLDSKIRNGGIEIIKKYDDVPNIRGDENSLSEAFVNILMNSIDAMPNGGAITLSIQPSEILDIEGNKIKAIRISIEDAGKGIPNELLSSIFDPFFTTRHEGTGLGLSIAHRIISEEHLGQIDVKSEVGHGTTFTIFLPAVTA